MKLIDFAKAFGVGVAALALNLLALVLAVFVYAQFVAPGHPQAHYNQMAPRLGAWTAPIVGPLLILLLVWAFSRRRPERNGFIFGAAVFAGYLAVDAGMGLAMGPLSALLTPPFIFGMSGAAVAALAGAALSRRKPA